MKSERNPKEDPLMLWLTGGPGCSALSVLTFEIGPFKFKMQEYNGSLPTLALNPHSWIKISSIILVDLPANTGFSYAKPPIATQRSDSKQIQHAHQFIRMWLMDHPEFFSNSFYVGGDSYSGMIVPAIALEILKGNEDSVKPLINYQGYILGNPITNITEDKNYKIPFAHGMGLISDELYQSLKSNCGEKYQNVDPKNEMCVRDMAAFEKVE
ncbi:serine carboxypeptidase-like 18 [Senna tora]|uniref:Serine carboxypeptidase-like 18 n=1 Tax=Senna tora TaxID=362788 RepID=A0A834T7V3_9FABA|nr:serine carboxypeptidase-like 18 [Senna tora]